MRRIFFGLLKFQTFFGVHEIPDILGGGGGQQMPEPSLSKEKTESTSPRGAVFEITSKLLRREREYTSRLWT